MRAISSARVAPACAAIVAALVIMFTGWTPIDPLLSVLIASMVLVSGLHLVRQSGHVLMEGSPANIDERTVKSTIVSRVPEVDDVHHLHLWSLTPGRPLLTLHAHVRADANHERVLESILACLHEQFGIDHATIQLEHGRCLTDGGARH